MNNFEIRVFDFQKSAIRNNIFSKGLKNNFELKKLKQTCSEIKMENI